MNNTIYVLHEYGDPHHYNALIELGKQEGFNVKFRIFHPKIILIGLFRKKFKQSIKSIWFLFTLPFSKRKKIVLGIAPFDKLIYPLSIILKKHNIFYHTSYTCWDGSIMARPTNSERLKQFWFDYIGNKTSHIFAVSKKTKEELIRNNISKADKISIVNHSFNDPINTTGHKKDNSYLFVGRLIENKGIYEMLSLFSHLLDATLTIIGKGELENVVKAFALKYDNIKFLGYINGLENIIPIYQQHSFLLMNSQRSNRWEELFGMAIIEGMASGCVPIATDHPGPKEIISNGKNGFIFQEGQLETIIQRTLILKDEEYQIIRNLAIERGQSFQSSLMASKWINILKS